LSSQFFNNKPVGLLQDAMQNATWEDAPQIKTYFMPENYDLIDDITNAAKAQVAWLSNFIQRNLVWKKLTYKQYNDFLQGLNVCQKQVRGTRQPARFGPVTLFRSVTEQSQNPTHSLFPGQTHNHTRQPVGFAGFG
jgi:hypothetical protein